MKRYLVLGILVLLMVGVVSAASPVTVTIAPNVDGWVYQATANATYETLQSAAGSAVDSTDTYAQTRVRSIATTETNKFYDMGRMVFSFNKSQANIPVGATVTSIVFYASRGTTSATGHGTNKYYITGGTLADNTTLAAGDYNGYINTLYSDTGYTSAEIDSNNESWIFNSDGISAFNNNDFLTLYVRDEWDYPNASFGGTWGSGGKITAAYLYTTERAGTGQDPYLEITYSIPETMSIDIYPYDIFNTTRILHNTSITSPTGTQVNITAAKGDIEPGTFVIKGHGYPNIPTGINLTPSSLSDGVNTIPASAIDLRLVKVWYQAMYPGDQYEATWQDTHMYYLYPELLLKNDSFIRVNHTAKSNEIWIQNGTYQGYQRISYKTDTIPSDATYNDSATLQPFTVPDTENKQVLITATIPDDQAAGNYTGTIAITNNTGAYLGNVTLNIRVLPFTLVNSTKTYGAYYRGVIVDSPTTPLNGEEKTESMYLADLQNMKAHGVSYPVNYNPPTSAGLNTSFSLMDTVGFPKDKVFWCGYMVPGSTTWDSTNNATLISKVTDGRSNATRYGITDLYVYGREESSTELDNLKKPYDLIHSTGSKVFTAINFHNSFAGIGDYLDWANIIDMSAATPYGIKGYNSTEESLWHGGGKKLSIYAYPQFGVENATKYRERYGYQLQNAGYDGVIDFAYEYAHEQSIWNDWSALDYDNYTSENVVYPTSNGIIDTLQWEGFREGVDDSRYADYLTYVTGNTTQATDIINSGISAGKDMSEIRGDLIDAILYYGGSVIPTSSFTKSRAIIRIPQPVTVTDTSTNTPTNWEWSWGDGSANTTTQNATHSYTRPGLFTIGQTASNIAGQSSTSSRVWVFRKPQQFSPFAEEYLSCDEGTYAVSRELSAWERLRTDERIMALCN